jgi:DNA-binding MarR family transcriptional regulator
MAWQSMDQEMNMALTVVVGDDEGAPINPVEELAGELRRLIICGEQFRNLRAKDLQVGSSDLVALGHLHNGGPMAPKELSALMGVSSGTMTALLDRGEKAGLLRRERNPEDRRGLLIHLTPAGLQSVQWVYEQFDAVVCQTLINVPAPSVDVLRSLLEQLNETLSCVADDDYNASAGLQQPLQLHEA